MREIGVYRFKKKADENSRGRVIIIDDSVADLIGPYHLLYGLGYEVQIFFDGQDALASITNDKFDFIVLDLNMPLTDGYEVLEILNSVKTLLRIKVIIYTGEQTIPELSRIYCNLDIIDIWKKPLQVSQIAAKLKKAE